MKVLPLDAVAKRNHPGRGKGCTFVVFFLYRPIHPYVQFSDQFSIHCSSIYRQDMFLCTEYLNYRPGFRKVGCHTLLQPPPPPARYAPDYTPFIRHYVVFALRITLISNNGHLYDRKWPSTLLDKQYHKTTKINNRKTLKRLRGLLIAKNET